MSEPIDPPAILRAPRTSADRRHTYIGGAILIALVLAIYLPVVRHDHAGIDDLPLVLENPNFLRPTLGTLADHWRGPHLALYIPVVYTLWWAVAFASSTTGSGWLSPLAYHVANVVAHGVAVLVVFRIYRRLVAANAPHLGRAGTIGAALAAAVFAAHPLQVETVAWISAMKDLLSGALCLLALDAAITFRLGSSPRVRAVAGWAAVGLFALACLAKPGVVAFGVVAYAIDRLLLPPRRATEPSTMRLVLPMVAVGLAVTWVTTIVQSSETLPPTVSVAWRPPIALDALGFYVAKFVLPLRLLPDYGRTPAWVVGDAWAYGHALVVLALVGGVAALCRLRPHVGRWALAGGVTALAALAPVSGLVRFNFQEFSTVADHYAYLAVFGAGLALLPAATSRRRWLRVALLVAVLAMAARSIAQVPLWRDPLTLWSYTLEHSPRSWNARYALANAYFLAGDAQRSEALARASVRLYPHASGNRLSLAAALLDLQRADEAAHELRELLSRFPNNAPARANFALALGMTGDLDGAIREYRRALAIDPSMSKARAMLDKALAMRTALERRRATTRPTPASEPASANVPR